MQAKRNEMTHDGKDAMSGGGMRRSSAIVLLGSVGGFAISFILTPVLSRLFTPEAFGLSSAIVALASVFVGVSTLRLEIIAQREPLARKSLALLWEALWIDLICAVLITVISIPLILITNSSWIWLVVGPLVFVASWQLIGAAQLTRTGRYGSLATSNFLQGAGLGGSQAILGLLWPNVGSLLAGYFIARLAWLPALFGLRSKERVDSSKTVWKHHRNHAVQAGTSALVNSLSTQALPLLITVLYGQVAVGLVAMAIRVLVSPLGVIAQAVSASAIGHVGSFIRVKDYAAARNSIRRAIRDQAVLGLVPCLLMGIGGPFLATIVLGEDWDGVGPIISAMALGAWAQFVGSPFPQILNLTGQSKFLLRWDLIRLFLLFAAVTIPASLGFSLIVSLSCFSVAQLATYWLVVKTVDSSLARTAE